jgi:response regulator RpfG family c-di-GMP phosphodiesterase
MPDQHLGTLLVVEDEDDLRFILMAHLRAAGFTALEAVDGAAAVKIAAERMPDLIIMDVGLPKMDGIAATKALKADERTAHIPVIMLTARSSSEDVVRGLGAGAQEYLAKPFDMPEFLARVQTVHRLATARRDLDRLNAQLEAEVDVKTRRLQLLYDFMRELNKADSRSRILDLIIERVEKMTGAQRISLLLIDDAGENLVCERAVGIDPSIIRQIRVRSVEGIAGQVFSTGKTLSALALETAGYAGREYHRDAFLSTPLVSTSLESQDGIIGVLNVTDKADIAPFTEDEIECVRSIADAAAIAIDNVVRRDRLRQSVRVLLRTVGHLAEYRDEETTQHLERVTLMSRILATELGQEGLYACQITDDFIESLVQAAPMHDIGKVGTPDDILAKPGKLTDEEFQIMKTHTEIGRRVLSKAFDPAHPVPLLQMCIDIAYCHHERYDGTGYPRRISGEQIPHSARIIALVDAYDAITSHRRYSPAKPHEVAVDIIRSDSGAHFDPVVVDAFLRCHEQFNEVQAQNGDRPEPVEAVVA